MKKYIICVIAISLLFIDLRAQIGTQKIFDQFYTHTISLSAGPNYYFGDIEKGGFFSKNAKNQINYCVYGNYSISLSDNFTAKAGLTQGRLSGSRNYYSFHSMFLEPDVAVEYFPWTMYSEDLKFYLFAGAGCTFSKVKFDDKGNPDVANRFRELQVYMPVVLVGAGYKHNLNDNVVLGVEFACRLAVMDSFSNNMDGFPFKRDANIVKGGESKFCDGYYSFGITLGYTWNY
ncbi:MAG: hypothetical protein LBT04_04155 [Prevotellaceae bacterium]|jgi:hypothetical protein|nr:hypothetical protein [Prevotellaceae bacterium]